MHDSLTLLLRPNSILYGFTHNSSAVWNKWAVLFPEKCDAFSRFLFFVCSAVRVVVDIVVAAAFYCLFPFFLLTENSVLFYPCRLHRMFAMLHNDWRLCRDCTIYVFHAQFTFVFSLSLIAIHSLLVSYSYTRTDGRQIKREKERG